MIDIATRCHRCGAWHLAIATHQCDRLAPRALPDRAPPARVARLPPAAPRPVVATVLAWDAARDLERLAAPAVQRHYYGRGVGLERAGARGDADPAARVGPLDHLSATDRAELAAIHTRFERLRHGLRGRLHYAVLAYVFLDHAAEQRYTPGVVASARDAAQPCDRFLRELGVAFASPVQRKAWADAPALRASRALARAAPQRFGARLYAAAVAAYEGRNSEGGTR